MLEIAIPGHQQLKLKHLVLDLNGTLACDGELLPGVTERLTELAQHLKVHVLTADTFGTAQTALQDTAVELHIIESEGQDVAKLSFLKRLGGEYSCCLGNGRNDRIMLKEAALGIVLIQQEGAALEALVAADVVCHDICDALDLLLKPARLQATLRS